MNDGVCCCCLFVYFHCFVWLVVEVGGVVFAHKHTHTHIQYTQTETQIDRHMHATHHAQTQEHKPSPPVWRLRVIEMQCSMQHHSIKYTMINDQVTWNNKAF